MKELNTASTASPALRIVLAIAALPVTAIMLSVAAPPGSQASSPQSHATASKPTPVARVTLPDQAIAASRGVFIVPVTVSKIDPAVHGNLQAFQGDFTYDSSIISFQSNPVTAGSVMINNGGQWSLMANPNLTQTNATLKTLRITAFCLNNVGLATNGAASDTLFTLNLVRVGKAGTETAMIWSSPPNGHFRFFDTEGFARVPSGAPPGKIAVSASTGRK